MRRALALLLAALPALALGQSSSPAAGAISANSNTVNLAQCNGSATNADLKLGDDMNVDLTWTIGGDFTAGTVGYYRLYVSSQPSAATETDGTSCTTAASSGSGTYNPQAVIPVGETSADISGMTATVPRSYSYRLSDIVSKAGVTCPADDSTTTVPVYLCVQWFTGTSPGGTAGGAATLALTVDPTTPTLAPTGLTASPGDGKLHLSCSAAGNYTSEFKATASLGGSVVAWSNQASSCSDLVIGGLTNGNVYSVVVYGISAANNPGPGSAPLSGTSTTPIDTYDYWDHYTGDNGQEQGGCSTGGTAAGLAGALALLSLLAALRRRNS